MATKTPSATIDIVVSWNTAATPYGDVQRGERYRVDDPRVVGYPEFFVPDGTPREEWTSPLEQVGNTAAEREAEEKAERDRVFAELARMNPVRLEAARIVKAQRDVVGWVDGRAALVKKGSTATENDPVVTQAPEHWQPA